MTQVLVEGVGWGDIVLGLAWYTPKLVGPDVGTPCTARPWLAALAMAVNRQVPAGAQGQGLSLLRDHGCQPTALTCLRACRPLGSQQACTSESNPKGQADTERVMRTLKDAGLWLQEWTDPCALMRALAGWIADDPAHDLHSALGDKSPRQFERDDYLSHGIPCVAA